MIASIRNQAHGDKFAKKKKDTFSRGSNKERINKYKEAYICPNQSSSQ